MASAPATMRRARSMSQLSSPRVARDGGWIAATCTRETGNVWSNPERTCQHAPISSAPLAPGATVRLEVKTFVAKAGLAEILGLVRAERARR